MQSSDTFRSLQNKQTIDQSMDLWFFNFSKFLKTFLKFWHKKKHVVEVRVLNIERLEIYFDWVHMVLQQMTLSKWRHIVISKVIHRKTIKNRQFSKFKKIYTTIAFDFKIKIYNLKKNKASEILTWYHGILSDFFEINKPASNYSIVDFSIFRNF
jgi:hypothetical protein